VVAALFFFPNNASQFELVPAVKRWFQAQTASPVDEMIAGSPLEERNTMQSKLNGLPGYLRNK
jgi:hypothetical protein